MNDFASEMIRGWERHRKENPPAPEPDENQLREMLAERFLKTFGTPHTRIPWVIGSEFGRPAAIASIPGTKVRLFFMPDGRMGNYRFEVRCIDPLDKLDREWIDGPLALGEFLSEYYNARLEKL